MKRLLMLLGLIVLMSPVLKAATVTLAWDDGDPNVTQWFSVYRSTGPNGPWLKVNAFDIPKATPVYTDPALLYGLTYYWYVTASANLPTSDTDPTVIVKESDKSNIVMVTIDIHDTQPPSIDGIQIVINFEDE